jgi:hypothetical protein
MHHRCGPITAFATVLASLTALLSAQAPTASPDGRRNPLAGNPEAIRQGAVLFRQE